MKALILVFCPSGNTKPTGELLATELKQNNVTDIADGVRIPEIQ